LKLKTSEKSLRKVSMIVQLSSKIFPTKLDLRLIMRTISLAEVLKMVMIVRQNKT